MRCLAAGLIAGMTFGAFNLAAHAAEEPFGQEKVETRPYRTPQRLGDHDHAHGKKAHGHAHSPGKASKHDHGHGKKGGHGHGQQNGKGHRHDGAVNRRDNSATRAAVQEETATALAAGAEPPEPPVFPRRGRLDLSNSNGTV